MAKPGLSADWIIVEMVRGILRTIAKSNSTHKIITREATSFLKNFFVLLI